ncbi:hypothetical protein [Arthrobacter psychrolactophilus]
MSTKLRQDGAVTHHDEQKFLARIKQNPINGQMADRRVVPNPVLTPLDVYEAKTKRWSQQWPSLNILPWP